MVMIMKRMKKDMNFKNKIVDVTRNVVNELTKRLKPERWHIKCDPAVITEELTHEFKRLWIYKRLHIRIG